MRANQEKKRGVEIVSPKKKKQQDTVGNQCKKHLYCAMRRHDKSICILYVYYATNFRYNLIFFH